MSGIQIHLLLCAQSELLHEDLLERADLGKVLVARRPELRRARQPRLRVEPKLLPHHSLKLSWAQPVGGIA